MNSLYEQYLKDEGFRADILAAAKRERAKAFTAYFARILDLQKNQERRHAAGPDFAREG